MAAVFLVRDLNIVMADLQDSRQYDMYASTDSEATQISTEKQYV